MTATSSLVQLQRLQMIKRALLSTLADLAAVVAAGPVLTQSKTPIRFTLD